MVDELTSGAFVAMEVARSEKDRGSVSENGVVEALKGGVRSGGSGDCAGSGAPIRASQVWLRQGEERGALHRPARMRRAGAALLLQDPTGVMRSPREGLVLSYDIRRRV